MKTINKSTSLFLFILFLMPVITLAQDKVIPAANLPAEIQNYIKTHFPTQQIAVAEIDYEGIFKEYEVKLNDKTKLEFDRKFQVKKLESKSALPETVIPNKINEYMKLNYPNNSITEWEKERKHQEVKLDNGLELEFTLKGKFIRIDY